MVYYGIGAPHTGKNEHLLSGYEYIFSKTYFHIHPPTKALPSKPGSAGI